MLRAYEASDYSQWLWTNFLAVPAFMLALAMLVASVGMIAVATQQKRWQDPEIQARFVFLAALDMAAGWMLYMAAGNAVMSHLWTPGNVAYILAPAILAAATFIFIYRQHEKSQKVSA